MFHLLWKLLFVSLLIQQLQHQDITQMVIRLMLTKLILQCSFLPVYIFVLKKIYSQTSARIWLELLTDPVSEK